MSATAKCFLLLKATRKYAPTLNNAIKCTALRASFFSTSITLKNIKLSEVGVLNSVKAENYQTGQLFVHKLFGYRGVILIPWTANVIEKIEDGSLNEAQYDKLVTDELSGDNTSVQTNKSRKLTFYQVLVDNRDIPHLRSQPESVTFLSGPEENRLIFSIHGLDYVSHNDVLPYTSTEKLPIFHELFDKFLMMDSESKSRFVAQDSLKAWQESNHSFLELTDVCIAVTNNIRITVIPFYIGIKWRYLVRIENLGKEPVTLRERHWKIFSRAGSFETVRGKGVVGKEPYLNSDFPVFQYSSHVNLESQSGHMWGTFKMERDDGSTFEARVPSFQLEAKDENKDLTE